MENGDNGLPENLKFEGIFNEKFEEGWLRKNRALTAKNAPATSIYSKRYQHTNPVLPLAKPFFHVVLTPHQHEPFETPDPKW